MAISRISLCDSFRSIAFETWRRLALSRAVGHQTLEETISDLNTLSLRISNPAEITTELFNKRDEGLNGADWEWWFLDRVGKMGFPVRIQAKVLQLRSNTFAHLHYKKKGIYQGDKLGAAAAARKMVPLYCFYLHSPKPISGSALCGTFPDASESFGCSLVSVKHIRSLRPADVSLVSVLKGAMPWHCLVCCEGFSQGTLPERVAATLRQRGFGPSDPAAPELQVRTDIPDYVRTIQDGNLAESPDPSLKGIIVVREAAVF